MQIADVTTSTNTTTYNVQLRRAAWHATCYLPRPEIEIKKNTTGSQKIEKKKNTKTNSKETRINYFKAPSYKKLVKKYY